MKRIAERTGAGAMMRPGWGYLAPCARCGLVVVHGKTTDLPYHMHLRSKRCRDLAAKRSGK